MEHSLGDLVAANVDGEQMIGAIIEILVNKEMPAFDTYRVEWSCETNNTITPNLFDAVQITALKLALTRLLEANA